MVYQILYQSDFQPLLKSDLKLRVLTIKSVCRKFFETFLPASNDFRISTFPTRRPTMRSFYHTTDCRRVLDYVRFLDHTKYSIKLTKTSKNAILQYRIQIRSKPNFEVNLSSNSIDFFFGINLAEAELGIRVGRL